MEPNAGLDACSPHQIAERVQAACVAKASTPLLSLAMLGILAGAFIGLGSLFSVIVLSDSSLGFAASRVLGGAVFSLRLLLVVVAGAVGLAAIVFLSGHTEMNDGAIGRT